MPGDTVSSDRNLLFGILAVQMDFISRDELVAALNAWLLAKHLPLGRVLLERGSLRADEVELLDALVAKHLQRHDNDPARSLQAVSSVGSLPSDLASIEDAGVQASLTYVSAVRREPIVEETQPLSPAGATSSGHRFRILRPHARGGLGEVFVAEDVELNREVALKQIQDRHADDVDSRARFLLEAEITGGLEHPGIVPVYGLGQYADGRPFYAMRFIRGDSLKDAIERHHKADAQRQTADERRLELRRLLGRFIDVCNAVDYAHSRGVLHRDLKPGNIMLGKYGETLVVDWGLAKSVRRAAAGSESSERPIEVDGSAGSTPTRMGSAVGTPQFMSPEQAAGRIDQLGPASDVYSLGATLYALLTGHPPVEDADVAEVLRKVERGDIRPPRAVNSDIPRALESICLRAMARVPRDRYSSPRALADDLEHWLADEPVAARSESFGERLSRWSRRHRAWTRAAVAALVLVAGVATLSAVMVNRARKATETAHELALARERESTRMLAENNLDRALGYAYSGNEGQGMLYMTRALEGAIQAGDRPLERVIRVNLGDWQAHAGVLSQEAIIDAGLPVMYGDISPDGLRLLTAGASAEDASVEIRLWDAATGAAVGDPLGGKQAGDAIRFSPDGKLIAIGCQDGFIRLFSTSTGQLQGSPLPCDAKNVLFEFSADGRRFVAPTTGNAAQIWDAATGKPIGPPMKHTGQVTAAVFSQDGKYVATGGFDKTARTWDAATSQAVSPPLAHPHRVDFVAFSPNGTALITRSNESESGRPPSGEIRLWDLKTWKPRGEPISQIDLSPEAFQTPVGANEVFTHDGETLITSGPSENPDAKSRIQIHLWNVETGAARCKPIDSYAVGEWELSPNAKTLAALAADRTVQCWDTSTGEPVGTAFPFEGELMLLTYNADGTLLAIANTLGEVQLHDVRTGRRLGGHVQHAAYISSMTFNPKSSAFVSCSMDQTARLWRIQRVPARGMPLGEGLGNERAANSAPPAPKLEEASPAPPTPPEVDKPDGNYEVETVAYSPDGQRILTCGFFGDVRLWSDAGKPLSQLPETSGQWAFAAFSPNGKLIVTGNDDGIAQLWDSATLATRGPALKHKFAVRTAAFSPDSKRLFVAASESSLLGDSSGSEIRRWDVATGSELGAPIVAKQSVDELHFGPDGRTFFTMNTFFGEARFRDAATGASIGEEVHPGLIVGGISQAGYRPDGRALIAVPFEAAARAFDPATATMIGAPLQHQGEINAAAYSPDGRWLLTAGGDRAVRLWNAQTLEPEGMPLMHEAAVVAAAWSHDSQLIATGCQDRTVQFWDVGTRRPWGALATLGKDIQRVVFNPRGTGIAVLLGDLTGVGKEVWLWPLPSSLDWSPERVELWTQVTTGAKLHSTGTIQVLDAAAWNAARRRLRDMARVKP